MFCLNLMFTKYLDTENGKHGCLHGKTKRYRYKKGCFKWSLMARWHFFTCIQDYQPYHCGSQTTRTIWAPGYMCSLQTTWRWKEDRQEEKQTECLMSALLLGQY